MGNKKTTNVPLDTSKLLNELLSLKLNAEQISQILADSFGVASVNTVILTKNVENLKQATKASDSKTVLDELIAKTFKTQKHIQAVIDDVQRMLDYVSGVEGAILPEGISEDTVEKYRKNSGEIIKLVNSIYEQQTQVDAQNKYPFSNFINGFHQLRIASEKYNEAQTTNNEELKKGLEYQAEMAKTQGMKYIYDGATEASTAVLNLGGMMTQLADATGDKRFSQYAAEMKDAANIINSTVAGGKSGGGWGALAGLAIGIGTSVFNGIAEEKKFERQWQKEALDYQNEFNRLLIERNYLEKEYNSGFGQQNIERAMAAYDSTLKSQSDFKEFMSRPLTGNTDYQKTKKDILNPLGFVTEGVDDILDSMGGVGKFFRDFGDQFSVFIADVVPVLGWLGIGKSTSNKREVLLDAQNRGMNSLQGELIQTKTKKWYKIGSSDRYTTLYDLAPEIWNGKIDGEFNVEAAKAFLSTNKQISDEQRAQLQYAVNLKEEYDKAIAVIDEHIDKTFGKMGESFANSIFDAVRNGENAFDSFKKTGLSVIDTLGKEMIKEFVISSYFEKYKERMRKAYGLDSVEDVQRELANITNEIFQGLPTVIESATTMAENWDKMAAEQGWDIESLKKKEEATTTRTATAQGIASMSQDSADALNGNFYALFMTVDEILQLMKRQEEQEGSQTANALPTLQEMLDVSKSSNTYLLDIRNNTSHLIAIDSNIGDMKGHILAIRNEGVKIRS